MLPPEILLMTFDRLSIAELLVASHVCTRWRTVAHRHTTFWRTIRLGALSTSALDLFHARLDASRDAVDMILLLETAEPRGLSQSAVLPALAQNLFRIRRLVITFPKSLDVELVHTLRGSAPILALLSLKCASADLSAVSTEALSCSLFDQHAPQLRAVELLNIRLPNPPPPAFRHVEALAYNFYATERFPIQVLEQCPHLVALAVQGGHLEVPAPSQGVALYHIPPHLRRLNVIVQSGTAEMMRMLPFQHIPHVTVNIQAVDMRPMLIGGLPGPLQLQLVVDYSAPLVTYHAGHMTRAFMGVAAQAKFDGELLAGYLGEEMLSRVHSLTISTGALGCIPLLRRLPACTPLNLWVHEGRDYQVQTGPLELPVLGSLSAISYAGQTQFVARDLATFLTRGIAGWPRRLKIKLVNMEMTGTLPKRLRSRVDVTACVDPKQNPRNQRALWDPEE